MNLFALIMAGGTGERFGTGSPKQLATLHGRAMIAWSAEVLARSPRVAGLVIVTAPGVEVSLREVLPEAAARKVRGVVTGGATRQESVFNGLQNLPREATHVLIHDAARPCLSSALLDRVVAALETNDAVIPAAPVTDTLVRELDARVDAILDRVHISGVQTPQGFAVPLIVRAHHAARERGFQSSDDGSLVLALAEKVATVPGERTNIKVTYREDLSIAEAILKNGATT
jgi:2-C-methyl-D-erythritol 4-phosphate cytidylyltransferase/2-C-methyl-D-erythritol 2,4-cyclodiphosphate synthase